MSEAFPRHFGSALAATLLAFAFMPAPFGWMVGIGSFIALWMHETCDHADRGRRGRPRHAGRRR